jgi:hypothetical protein
MGICLAGNCQGFASWSCSHSPHEREIARIMSRVMRKWESTVDVQHRPQDAISITPPLLPSPCPAWRLLTSSDERQFSATAEIIRTNTHVSDSIFYCLLPGWFFLPGVLNFRSKKEACMNTHTMVNIIGGILAGVLGGLVGYAIWELLYRSWGHLYYDR